MGVSRKTNTFPVDYINNITLESASCYNYLGVRITSNLTWNTHIDYIYDNANRMFDYLKPNFSIAPVSLKLLIYKTLVLTKLEYAAAVWGPR